MSGLGRGCVKTPKTRNYGEGTCADWPTNLLPRRNPSTGSFLAQDNFADCDITRVFTQPRPVRLQWPQYYERRGRRIAAVRDRRPKAARTRRILPFLGHYP